MNLFTSILDLTLKPLWRGIVWLYNKVQSLYPTHPFKTISIVHVNRANSCRWHMGKMKDEEVMYIIGDFLITNLTKDITIKISGAQIGKHNDEGLVLIKGPAGASSQYYIDPKAIAEIQVQFWIKPLAKIGENYIEDVAVIDNYGNKHWIYKCHFVYT